MYELNVKDESDIGNKNEVKFSKFEDELDKKDKKKRNSKKSKNKNYPDKLKVDLLKKSDENEYLGNKSNKIIIDDEYNSENINFKTAFSYF